MEEAGAYYINRHTFLLDHQARHRYRLMHAECIAHDDGPDEVIKAHDRPLHFTLYFSGLLWDCTQFDLVERTTDLFPFTARNIQRNRMDVYRVTFSEHRINNHQPNNH